MNRKIGLLLYLELVILNYGLTKSHISIFAKFSYVILLRNTLKTYKIYLSKLILLIKALKSITNAKKFGNFKLKQQ